MEVATTKAREIKESLGGSRNQAIQPHRKPVGEGGAKVTTSAATASPSNDG